MLLSLPGEEASMPWTCGALLLAYSHYYFLVVFLLLQIFHLTFTRSPICRLQLINLQAARSWAWLMCCSSSSNYPSYYKGHRNC
ncbi:unnamed protein product, partial [Vitis vinifera]|uniref:Uncharacterized protein n=1 Tax=Vitis vinifera TaxID=29760 RepID=D7SYS2_VITVI